MVTNPVIENLQFRLSVLQDKKMALNRRARSTLVMGKLFSNRELFRLGQIDREIQLIKYELIKQRRMMRQTQY